MSQPYVYKTITLTVGALTNLLDALKAIDSTIQATYREVNLQADPGNTTNNVLIGSDGLTTTTFIGVVLAAGASRTYRQSGSGMEGVPIANMYILASAGSPKLNVELVM